MLLALVGVGGCASPSAKIELSNAKTGENVICPEGLSRPRGMTSEQAVQQRAWHAEFQRAHNRVRSPLEGCLAMYEMLGFERAPRDASERPMRPDSVRSERVFTGAIYGWSISYPDGWILDSTDPSFVKIRASPGSSFAQVGIHSIPGYGGG